MLTTINNISSKLIKNDHGTNFERFVDAKTYVTYLTHNVPCISETCIEMKINLNFYFHTLWCLKRFYEGLKDLYKTF